MTMHAFVREGGNVKVLQCKYERVFRGNGTFVLLVDICDCACICQRERERVAILKLNGVNTNVCPKDLAILMC